MNGSHLPAYREAGYAIAAWFLTECPIEAVTIAPGYTSIGVLAREHFLDDDILVYFKFEDDDGIRENRNRIEDALIISLAGPYAQRRHDPSSKWRRGGDLTKAADLVYQLHRRCRSQVDVIPLFWRYTNTVMDDFLNMHWSGVETLAHRLIREQTVSRDEALAAVAEISLVELADHISASPRLSALWNRSGPTVHQ